MNYSFPIILIYYQIDAQIESISNSISVVYSQSVCPHDIIIYSVL